MAESHTSTTPKRAKTAKTAKAPKPAVANAPARTTTDYDGRTVGYPPDAPAEQRRAWFQHEMKQHKNPATGRGWTQADVANEVGCVEAHVSLVLGGTRKTGDVTKKIQRVVARVLRRAQADLFGVVCTGCPRCGASHAPHRIEDQAAAGVDAPDAVTVS